MPAIRLTSKRQATLPKALCDELKIGPGDTLLVDRAQVDGEVVWCLRAAPREAEAWVGALSCYGVGKAHDMESIRASIERGREDARPEPIFQTWFR